MSVLQKPTGILLDPVFKRHQPGMGHPERPERYDAVSAALEPLVKEVSIIAPRPATEEEMRLCHSSDYLDRAKSEIKKGYDHLSTGDTAVGPGSWEVAVLAAGGVCEAVDAVCRGRIRNAFCAVRPPGHHATPNRGMGFCVLNNIAIAARFAQKRFGIERVLIADWDVHHGNGTQDIFYSDGSVFFFSTHQSPWYPGTGPISETGDGAGARTTMNRPFPSGAGKSEILGAFRRDLAPAMDNFKPGLILISAGFDSRLGDPLGQFRLNDPDFGELTHLLLEIADKHAESRLVSVLEGGYSLDGLTRSVEAHARALAAR